MPKHNANYVPILDTVSKPNDITTVIITINKPKLLPISRALPIARYCAAKYDPLSISHVFSIWNALLKSNLSITIIIP